MTKIDVLHRRWRKDADYKGADDALNEEFDLTRRQEEARLRDDYPDLETRRVALEQDLKL